MSAAFVDISRPGAVSVPYTYTLATGEEWQPQTITATFDGTGAGSAFIPCLSLYSQDGTLRGRFPADQVTAGDTAQVTWAPFLRGAGSAGTSGFTLAYDKVITVPTDTIATGANAIAQTGKHLLIVTKLQYNGDSSVLNTANLIFSGDSITSHYGCQRLFDTATTVVGAGLTTALPGLPMCECPGGGAPAGTFATSYVYIPDYTSTDPKTVIGLGFTMVSRTVNTNDRIAVMNGLWTNPGLLAVTSFQITTPSLSPQLFVANSRVTAYILG